MNDYIIAIKGTEKLGDQRFLSGFFQQWLSLPMPQLQPNKFGFGEPLKNILDMNTCHEFAASWVQRGSAGILGRTKKPKFSVDMRWRKEKGKDRREFPWGCVVWLDRSAGDSVAEFLLGFLIESLEPVFAYITTEADEDLKHFIRYKDKIGMIEKYVGLEVGEHFPGIYWRTYFGPWAVEKIGGLEKASSLSCPVKRLEKGLLLESFEKSDMATSDSAKCSETAIVKTLGMEFFFDVANFNLESLKVNNRTANAIEQAVAEAKIR